MGEHGKPWPWGEEQVQTEAQGEATVRGNLKGQARRRRGDETWCAGNETEYP